jgi:cell division protein FtsB
MGSRLLVSLYTAILIYLVTLFFFGATGYFAYRNLEKQFEILEKNVVNLRGRGEDLSYSVAALRSDPDRIVKEARRLLLLQPREGVIRVEGYRGKPRPLSPGGLVFLKKDNPPRAEPYLRAFAAVSGLLIFLFYKPRRK